MVLQNFGSGNLHTSMVGHQHKCMALRGSKTQITSNNASTSKFNPNILPYLRMYKPHFFDKNLPSKIGVRLIHGVKKPISSEKKLLSYRRLSP
jgi:hypothetical protein